MGNKLENAVGIYMTGIRDGDPDSAMSQFTGARYTQHSTGVTSGQQGFKDFFSVFLMRNPQREIKLLRSIEDGRYVFCHVFQSLNGGSSEWVTMDMFDTDANDRVIEHWDVIEAYQTKTVSSNDMLGSETRLEDLEETKTNKNLVKEFTKQVLIEKHYDRLDAYVDEDLIQRDPQLESGRDGLKNALLNGVIGNYEMLFKVIGQGNLVVTYSKVYKLSEEFAVFDLYRLSHFKIVEHWNVSEVIPPRKLWGNSGKF